MANFWGRYKHHDLWISMDIDGTMTSLRGGEGTPSCHVYCRGHVERVVQKQGLWNVGFTLAAIVTIPKSSPSLWVLLCLPSSVMVGLWQPGFSHMSIHFQHQPSDLSSRRVPFHDQKRLNWVILVSKWSTSTEENNLVYHCNILIYIVINVFPWTWNKMEILLRIPHLTQSQLLLPKLPVVSGTGSFSYSWENSPDVSGTKLCWDWRNCDGVGTVRKDTGNLGNLTIRVEPR